LDLSNFRCCLQEKWPYFWNGQNDRVRFEDTVRAKLLASSLFLFVWLAIPGAAQYRQGAQQRIDAAPNVDDETRDRISRDLAKRINQERQAALKADTEKLVKLAEELKEYVDKSNENVLSIDVLKKAEAIEKLAHSVKDKMKGPN
jgi:nitric oxide reductase activation protein